MFRRFLARLRGRAPLRLTLYTRADCPLCDEMKAELARFSGGPAFELEELDIALDPELQARHGLSIPVLAIEGRPAFKGRLTAAELRVKLVRRAQEIAAGASPARGGRTESRP